MILHFRRTAEKQSHQPIPDLDKTIPASLNSDYQDYLDYFDYHPTTQSPQFIDSLPRPTNSLEFPSRDPTNTPTTASPPKASRRSGSLLLYQIRKKERKR